MPEAPIDDAAFAELLETVGGDLEFLAELIDTYLGDSPGLFAQLRAAIAAGDAVTARRAARHSTFRTVCPTRPVCQCSAFCVCPIHNNSRRQCRGRLRG